MYNIPRAVRNLWKNWRASLNSVLIVASSLAVLGMIAILYLNVVHISEILLSNTTVSLFLKPGISAGERDSLLEKVQKHPMVNRAALVTPEQGLKSFASKLGADHSFLLDIGKSSLPHTIDFDVFLNYRKRIGDIAAQLGGLPGVEEAVYAERLIEKVKLFFDLTRGVGLFFSALILISFCLIIANSTRLSLHSRRQEIEILHLAGATRGFIRSGFLVEGVLVAVVGWVVAVGLVGFAFKLIVAGLTWNAFTMRLKDLSVFFSWQMLVGSLLVIMALGAVSSQLSVNRMLREIEP
jgi:cell division transport system permease protein